ncbi:MAG: sensor histidine kinase [Thiogranum sp.]|nr:sensor histidine kinase [Thiogranum sp.]
MTSLRSRLGAGMVVSLVVMIGLLLVVAGVSVRALMEQQVASRLAHDGETLLGGLDISADGSITLDTRRVQGIYQQPFSGHYFIIDVEGEIIRSRSLWDVTLQVPEVETGETRLTYIDGPEQQPLLLWTSAFRKQDHRVRLAVAEDLVVMRSGTRQLQLRLLGWALVVTFLLLLVQQYIVSRTLRPVAAAADEVARLSQGDISALSEQVPDEVRPLVAEINKLLRRQQQRLQRSREALGNLAHAIKTPLTLLQQIAGGKEAPDATTMRAEVRQCISRINELVDKSLRRARLAGDSLGVSRFDLGSDLPMLVDTVQRLHKDKPVRFGQDIGSLKQLPLEQQDGMELLGNLLDNAWKWSRGRVQLTIADSAGVQIRVEDDGPGVDASALAALTQRGMRHDESVPGHGIGLSIVKGLVEELGGTVTFGASAKLGGLRVEIRL